MYQIHNPKYLRIKPINVCAMHLNLIKVENVEMFQLSVRLLTLCKYDLI